MEKATLSCLIAGFRPEEITVTFSFSQPEETSTVFYCWPSQRHTDGNDMEATVPLRNNLEMAEYCGGSITGHANIKSHWDGTYSLSCRIIIVPDADKHHGAELCLTIQHKGFEKPVHQTRLLSVVRRSPKVSEIMEPPRIIHQESITLTCPINGFQQSSLQITWIRKKHSKEEELVEYDSGTDKVNYFSEKYSHTTSKTSFSDGTFSFLSALSFAPSITADNEAVFLCRILHYATKAEAEKTLALCVKAQPTLDLIQAVPELPCTEDRLTLSCRIHSFFPQTLKVKWYKNDVEVLTNISISDIARGSDGLCSCTTTVEVTPCKKDVGMEFICRVGHESLKNHKGFLKHKEAKWMLKSLISSPKPLEIVCEPKVPKEGESVTLSCVVKDYYPPECEVRWNKESQPFEAAIVEAPRLCEETEIYHRKSHLTFTPTKDDHNSQFSVEVIHCGQQLRRTFPLLLKDFPIVKAIIVDPNEVLYGEPVALSCQVKGCDPKDLTVTWFQNGDQIRNGLSSRMPPLDIKDHTIKYFFLDLIPTAFHYNKEFICKVKHKNLQQSINKRMYLPLKAHPPVISDIIMTPAEPDPTKNLQMCINVSDFAPKEIHIKWYNSWTEFSKDMVTCSEPNIGANALYCASSQAEFKPELSDKDIKIRCEVTHSSTKTVLEKMLQFNFKGCEPEMQKEEQSSEIQCLTSNPKAGEIVVLKYFIAGCSASNASVSWFDGIYPIDKDFIENLDDKDNSGYTSTVTFQTDPKNTGRECEIRCEVMKDHEKTEKIYFLKFT